ncbi:MAG: hypothetical protein M3O76_01725 [Actinomycetota bacterium]|nr:hypothetical protein [Actinomycetota bacterium]
MEKQHRRPRARAGEDEYPSSGERPQLAAGGPGRDRSGCADEVDGTRPPPAPGAAR